MNNNDRIRITFINNQILFNLEDAARLLGFKSLKSSLQILPDEVVYQLTIRNDTIFDVLKFINIKGLELLIRHSNYTFEYTDKDMIVKEITTETPPYSFLDGLVKVIPTTANIIIEFPECMINCNVKTEMVRLYSATEIAAEFGIRGKKLNMLLEIEGVQRKRNNRWHLLKKYEKCGYIGYKPNNNSNMYWTEKGKFFIEKLLEENGYEKISIYDE